MSAASDTRLVALCAALSATTQERYALYARHDEKAEDQPDALVALLEERAEKLLDQMMEIPATSLEGILARARALMQHFLALPPDFDATEAALVKIPPEENGNPSGFK